MTTRIDQVVALAAELGAARAEVVRIEAELDALLGGGATKRVPREKPVGKVATAASHGRPVSPARDQVLSLAKEGASPNAIAEKLGLTPSAVAGHLFRARKAGTLPKAEASR
jgi:DNA-binding CsgD family transcriptional regulator